MQCEKESFYSLISWEKLSEIKVNIVLHEDICLKSTEL